MEITMEITNSLRSECWFLAAYSDLQMSQPHLGVDEWMSG